MKSWLRRRTTRSVVIHTRDGQSIRGELYRVTSEDLVLLAAHHLDQNVALAGETVIPRPNVAFCQVAGVLDWEEPMPALADLRPTG